MLSALFFASSIKLAAAGAATPYATLLARIQHDWPAAEHGFPALSCEVTKGEPRLVGLRQSLSIDAPLGRVSEVLDAFEKYGEISPSFDDVHVVIRTNKDSVLTSWTRHIPLFFLPNLRYELRYLIDRSHPGRVDYRSTLETSDHLKAAEGLIIVEAVSPASTRLYRLDYIGPPAGVFAAAPTARLWDDTLSDLSFSGFAIKLRAEHSDWPASQVVAEARARLSRVGLVTLRTHCTKTQRFE